MKTAYEANLLPLDEAIINQSYFFEELIDATTKLEVYKEKIKDSKLDSSWFMPTLQQKEALGFLETDCTADEFSWLREVFEQVAKKTQSRAFVDCL